jgi:hypothetical protein
MEYYLAVRMRRFGRTFPGAAGAAAGGHDEGRERGLGRTTSHSSGVDPSGTAVAGVGAVSRAGTTRPVARHPNRPPGRY